VTVTQATDFDRFFRAEFPRLVTAAAALTGSREVAKEVAQESMLRAYREWRRVSSLDIPAAWVRRVAINLAIDRSRRVKRERAALSRAGHGSETVTLADEFDTVWEAVRRLPGRQREIVVLRYVYDLPVAEIAATLEIATGTVTASLHKARRTLAAALGSEELR